MENLLKNELFCKGLVLGINIFQQMLLAAYDRNEPLIINEEPYYILSSDKLLEQMLDAICK